MYFTYKPQWLVIPEEERKIYSYVIHIILRLANWIVVQLVFLKNLTKYIVAIYFNKRFTLWSIPEEELKYTAYVQNIRLLLAKRTELRQKFAWRIRNAKDAGDVNGQRCPNPNSWNSHVARMKHVPRISYRANK